jgi:hypothetical protein
MTIPEYKTTTIEKQKFILSHYGLGKSCWDWLILIVSFYVAIVVPYNATFKEKRSWTYVDDDDESSGLYGGGANQSSPYEPGASQRRYADDEQVCEIDTIDIFVEVVFIIGECRRPRSGHSQATSPPSSPARGARPTNVVSANQTARSVYSQMCS